MLNEEQLAWQISHYTKPAHERTSRDDYMPQMDFESDFSYAIEKALELRTQNDVYDIRVVEWRDGEPEEDIDINAYKGRQVT